MLRFAPALALALINVWSSPARADSTAPQPAAGADESSRYDQFWPLAAGWGAWAHGDRIDVGPRDGDKKRTRAKFTIRWGTVLDTDGARLLLDGGCGAPGTTAKDAELCLLDGAHPPRALSLPATASKRDYPRGGLLLADGRVLVSNGLHVALVHADGTTWDREAMPMLRERKLIEDSRARVDGNLHCGQFVMSCEAGWKVVKPLARGPSGGPELELAWCKGGESCWFDTARRLAVVAQPGADAVEWKRLDAPPPVEPGLEEMIERARKKH